jgi:urea transport system substrate-binding protein
MDTKIVKAAALGDVSRSRRQFLRDTGLVVAGASALPLLAACSGSGKATAGATVKVGSIIDATGAFALYGAPKIAARDFAIKEINDAGGLLGKKLEVAFFDAKSDQAQYLVGARKLAADKEIVVVHGGVTSASREAVRPVFSQFEKLYFYDQFYEGGVCDRNTFCSGVVPTQQLAILVPYLIKNFGPRIYAMFADYNWGQIASKWLKFYADKHGGEIVGQEFVPLTVTGFDSSVQKIQQAAPDVVIHGLIGSGHLNFFRSFSATGLKSKIPLVSVAFGLANEQNQVDPKDVEGMLVAMAYFEDVDTPESKDFVKRFRAQFPKFDYINDEVNSDYIGWKVWAEGVKAAGSFDREAVIDALQTKPITVLAPEGNVTLSGASHHVSHNIRLCQVTGNRRYKVIETFPNQLPTFENETCDLVKDPKQSLQREPTSA